MSTARAGIFPGEGRGMSLGAVNPEPAYYIASVGRALTLLSAFAEQGRLTVSEAAALLGVAPSTAHRLLQMLIHHGYVVQGDRHAYVRSPAVRPLAPETARGEQCEAAAQPRLAALRDTLHGSVSLLALEGNCARFVSCAVWHDGTPVAVSRAGWLLPAHTLAGGKAMLASLSVGKIEAMYPDGVPATRFGRLYSMAHLHRELRDVRGRGYATSQDAHEDIHSLGVLLPSTAAPQVMALSVAWDAGHSLAVAEQEAVPLMRAAAQELAAALARADRP